MGVRLRLYGCERLRRERLIGEIVVGFASVNLDIVAPMWLILEPKTGATVWPYERNVLNTYDIMNVLITT
jgi:synaptotagmin-14/16